MTDFHALDLSGDRAALHRWDGRGWTPVGTTPIHVAGTDMGRVLADLLTPVAGMSVAVALPTDRIAVTDIPAQADTPHAPSPDGRTDWVALPGGGWRRMSLPDTALTEIEAFLIALGVRPGGCMAAAGDDLPPVWFGTSASPLCDGRATDRPACLGPASAAPRNQVAAARLRAHAVAARDPAHQVPLPDPGPDSGAGSGRSLRLPGLALPSRRTRSLLAATLVLAAVGVGLLTLLGGTDRDPAGTTPDIARLAAGPAAAVPPVAAGRDAPGDPPRRAALPLLDGTAEDGLTRDAPRPSQQAGLSAMDAPPGMIPDATFFTPPYTLMARVADDDTLLIIPGLDPVFRTDALALADARPSDREPGARRTLNAPGPPEQVYVVDENGLIRPSAEGRVSPDGFTVIAGAPPAAVRPRPDRTIEDQVLVMRRADLPQDDPLRSLLPRLRPDGLAESRERDRLGGRTAGELADFAPDPRPASLQKPAGTAAPVVVQAVALGPRPAPRDTAAIAQAQATAQRATGPVVQPGDVARVSAPTRAYVAEQATTRVRMNLSQVNLLGTFGAGNSRRALVRLPSGRIVNLSVGDQVDGGRVQSIGDGRLGYVKSGQAVTLVMPGG